MRHVRGWLLRLLGLFRESRLDREFSDELECHLELDIENGVQSGLSREEARRQAVLRLDGIETVKARQHEQRGIPILEALWRDLIYATRQMRSHPGFTATIILTLGLGIGATTAIFTVVNGVLLRPLPYPEPDRLVYVSAILSGEPNFFTYTENYAAFRDRNRTLSTMAAYMSFMANAASGDQSERVDGGLATRSFFELVGAKFALGRNFLPDEDKPGGPPVVILSDGYWRKQFGADASVIGKGVVLDGVSYNVVGVLPRGFRVPHRYGNFDEALWLPFAISGNRAARDEISAYTIGRLKPGATVQQAEADLDRLQQVQLRDGTREKIVVSEWQTEITRDARGTLLIFLCAVGIVLLIACVNVANLLLSRAATRETEIAVRRALGAGRGRIIRQLLTESVVMGLAGGLLGLALAYWGKNLLISFIAPTMPSLDPVSIDGRVLLANIAIGVLTGLAFGLAPALQVSKFDLSRSLKESGRGASEGVAHQRLRGLLVVSEVAVAMLLLSGAGLFVRSFLNLRSVDAGYDSSHILMMRVDLTQSDYKTAAEQSRFYGQALERITNLPGVRSAGIATSPPFSLNSLTANGMVLEGRPPASISVSVVTVSPDYFRTLRIPLLRGRSLLPSDGEDRPSVVLVNESFARQFYPDGRCLGRHIENWAKQNDWITIVGVVRDVRTYLDREIQPEIYRPYMQVGGQQMSVVVRTVGDPMPMAKAVRAQIASVDKMQPTHDVRTLEQAIDESLTQRRVKMLLVVVFGVLALSLGAVGIYGVLSYAVRRRAHEIGVRLALGADRGKILGLVIRNGLGLVTVGTVVGLVASLGLAKLISSELWGVSATDPWTLIAVASVLLSSGFLACLLPGLRAARIDPMSLLRRE
jgi:predicted permease